MGMHRFSKVIRIQRGSDSLSVTVDFLGNF